MDNFQIWILKRELNKKWYIKVLKFFGYKLKLSKFDK